MKTNNKNYLVIAHDILADISDQEIIDTLGVKIDSDQVEIIHFDFQLEHGDTMGFGWQELKTKQFNFFKKEIEPRIQDNPNACVVYFGLAPIPLAIHLGFLVSALKKVQVFQKNHDRKDWKWSSNDPVKPISRDVPKQLFKGAGDVVLLCSTSYPINLDSIHEIVLDPLNEIMLTLKKTGRDVFDSEEGIMSYSSGFRDVMDQISNNLVGTNGIHLFCSIPVGLAFLMGQEIQPNIHPDLIIYEYKRDSDPCYLETFIVQRDPIQERIVPKEEIVKIQEFREFLEVELNNEVKAFVEKYEEGESWFKGLFPKENIDEFNSTYWKNLAPITKTRLLESTFSKDAFDESESQFFVGGKWYLSDALIFALMSRMAEQKDLLSAFRLFWFHEVLHVSTHNLHSGNTSGVGRYPKVIEEADYQADVYALLHEFSYHKIRAANVKNSFLETTERMIMTMWAFDDLNPSPRMQVRRIGRYLIWYYQYVFISEYCQELNEILSALSNKPIIELRLVGLTSPDKQRLEIDLKGYSRDQLGLAVLHNNQFKSRGFGNGQLSLDRLMDGFLNRDHNTIVEVMRQFVREIQC